MSALICLGGIPLPIAKHSFPHMFRAETCRLLQRMFDIIARLMSCTVCACGSSGTCELSVYCDAIRCEHVRHTTHYFNSPPSPCVVYILCAGVRKTSPFGLFNSTRMCMHMYAYLFTGHVCLIHNHKREVHFTQSDRSSVPSFVCVWCDVMTASMFGACVCHICRIMRMFWLTCVCVDVTNCPSFQEPNTDGARRRWQCKIRMRWKVTLIKSPDHQRGQRRWRTSSEREFWFYDNYCILVYTWSYE